MAAGDKKRLVPYERFAEGAADAWRRYCSCRKTVSRHCFFFLLIRDSSGTPRAPPFYIFFFSIYSPSFCLPCRASTTD